MSGTQAVQVANNRRQSIETIVRLAQMQMLTWMSRVDASNMVESWLSDVLPGAYGTLQDAQRAAAEGADEYVAQSTAAMGLDPATQYRTDPTAFTKSAADGRPLATMLTVPVLRGRLAIQQRGQSADWVLGQVRQSVALMTASEIQDAGRSSAGVAMAATPTVLGYVRVVGAGACALCTVLAGRWYRYNAGFLRHKRCQCTGVPAGAAHSSRIKGWQTDPRDYFHTLSAADQSRIFTIAGAKAIRDGADISQVVNARSRRRGVSSLQTATFGDRRVLVTTEGATRRGLYGGLRTRLEQIEGRSVSRLRLTPDAIYSLARDREEAVRLLARNGYLNLSTAAVAAL